RAEREHDCQNPTGHPCPFGGKARTTDERSRGILPYVATRQHAQPRRAICRKVALYQGLRIVSRAAVAARQHSPGKNGSVALVLKCLLYMWLRQFLPALMAVWHGVCSNQDQTRTTESWRHADHDHADESCPVTD